jgi:hypothetical protein
MKAPDYRVMMKLPPMNAAAVIMMIRKSVLAVNSADGASWLIGYFSDFKIFYFKVLT